MSQQKLIEIKNLVEGAGLSIQQAKQLLSELVGGSDPAIAGKAQSEGTQSADGKGGQVIEGVFDGQHMIGPDGKQYSIPANYASKSKLVEGDMLKLTIDPRGHFLYKQIGPIERTRIKGILAQDEQSGEWRVVADGKSYKVILASVTYYKGDVGDEAVILVPQDKSSSWAAVENIIKKGDADFGEDLPMGDEPASEPKQDLKLEPIGDGVPSSPPVPEFEPTGTVSDIPSSIPETPAMPSSAPAMPEAEPEKPHSFIQDAPVPSPSPSLPGDIPDFNNITQPDAPTSMTPGQSAATPTDSYPSAVPESSQYNSVTSDDDNDEFEKI